MVLQTMKAFQIYEEMAFLGVYFIFLIILSGRLSTLVAFEYT